MTNKEKILLLLLKGSKESSELRIGGSGAYTSRLIKDGLIERLKVNGIKSSFYFLSFEGWEKASKILCKLSWWKKFLRMIKC